MSTTTTSMLDAALAYARQGLHVFPLQAGSKIPLSGSRGLLDATTDETTISKWWSERPLCNIGIATGPSDLIVVDRDDRHGGDLSFEDLISDFGANIFDTAIIHTPSGGRHYYFKAQGFNLPSSAGKLGRGIDVRAKGGYVVTPPSIVKGCRYSPEIGSGFEDFNFAQLPERLAMYISEKSRTAAIAVSEEKIPQGTRNTTLTSIAGSLWRPGYLSEEILTIALLSINHERCKPPLSEKEVRSVAHSVAKYPTIAEATEAIKWGDISYPYPILNKDNALYGLAGDFVRLVAPHTEASEPALLTQFLTAAGVMFGRNPYFSVGATKHYCKINNVIVGPTAGGRKGAGIEEIKRAFSIADTVTFKKIIVGGLATGEGIIRHFADPVDDESDDESPHAPVDKRGLVIDPEFSRIIKKCLREQSILSETIRDMYDSGDLQNLTKVDPLKASGTHIAIIAHTTMEELLPTLPGVEAANGFANRFMFTASRRAQKLPHGGNLHDDNSDLIEIAGRLQKMIAFAHTVKEMKRDEGANQIWESFYNGIIETGGMLGALTMRSDVITLRLSMIFALLDGKSTISAEHLKAALAVWRYCEVSAKYIFGDKYRDSRAARILNEARAKYPAGIDGTEVHKLFGGHVSSEIIGTLVAPLIAEGRLRREQVATGGRNREILYAVPPDECELSEKSPQATDLNSHNSLNSQGVKTW